MDRFFGIAVFLLLVQHGFPRSMPEEQSVVSDYTKEGAGPNLDVYQQIANNIAERITSPIYRFLGYNSTHTATTTKKPWDKVEILETPSKPSTAVNNDITTDTGAEQLSGDFKKTDKKPEKVTLYSNYLPLGKLEVNDTNASDDDFDNFGFDDVEGDDDVKPRDGPFVYFLELVGSFIQLVYGGLVSLFTKSRTQNNN